MSDLDNLIDTFFDHLSGVEEILEGDVDRYYFGICVNFTFKTIDLTSFFSKIYATLQRILERGSKEKLDSDVVDSLLRTLVNISKIFPTRSSIITLIKPYIKDWLRIQDNFEDYGILW
ncbi:hypothetical protein ADUPG1_010865 [Aduncisulcus paluster]|uniref:Uncharacterized protein n=1 Tax=Aduncisulcus paluster TaxID=2918883 RepID=A0ABQ5JX69_9EUKA|nr:hypothetical protein ADUPG1_010865 [Aduncisulcus paluster]